MFMMENSWKVSNLSNLYYLFSPTEFFLELME